MTEKQTHLIVMLVIFLALSIGFNGYQYFDNKQTNDNALIASKLLFYESEYREVYKDAELSNFYYDQAAVAYDLQDFDEIIRSCQISREYSNEFVVNVKGLKAKVNGEVHPVTIKYSQVLQEAENIYYNLYEACEHLEGASRKYKNDDYIGGGDSIDSMNEKILAHDEAVKRHNDYWAEYQVEIEKLIEEFVK